MHSIHLTVDRFEGDGKKIAVLVAEDGPSVEFPRAMLPKGTKAGDILRFSIDKDEAETKRIADETARIQDKLSESDDGGDLKL